MWHEIARTDDGSSHQLREERHVKSIVEHRGEGAELASVDVDGVAHALEREETDAHRQEDVPRLEIVANHCREHPCEEIGVFEVSKQS